MSNTATETPNGVQSVDRALRILEILARSGESGVTEMAQALEVHKSTAFRLVATLEQHGLVEQVEGRGKYRLGVGLLRLAGATSARLDVVQEARPLCKQLAALTGETVNLATLSGHSALYLDQVAGPSALQPHNWVGQHIPLHATSNGKVLMAWLPAAELGDLLGRLPAYTGLTITTQGQAAQAARGRPGAGVRRRGRRARGRAHRDRRAGPQRPRRRRLLDEHLRARPSGSPPSGSRTSCPSSSRPPTSSPTGSAGGCDEPSQPRTPRSRTKRSPVETARSRCAHES